MSENSGQDLQHQIEQLQSKIATLTSENCELRKKNYDILVATEQEEEYLSNMLIRQINRIRKEKCSALELAEKEEEYLTNMMTRKLQQLQREKILLENAMEAEQEYLVNKLYRQIELLSSPHKRQQLNEASLPPTLECLLKEIRSLEAQASTLTQQLRSFVGHVIQENHIPSKQPECQTCTEMVACASVPR